MAKKTKTPAQPAQPAQPAPAAPAVVDVTTLSLVQRLELIRPQFPAPPDFHEVLQEIAAAVEGK